MKLSIFVQWICVQILSTQCEAFLNHLNASDVSTKVCIQKTINQLFSYDDTLSLILDNDICEEAIFEMNTTRPYISLNMNTDKVIQLQYEGQFIICPANASSLKGTVYRMYYEATINNRGLGNSKMLVITNTTDASDIFKMFWYYNINNVIVLFYGQGISKLSMCDRYSPENACGKTVKSIIYQSCEEQVTLSFTNVIHQMNKCPITFMHIRNDIYDTRRDYPTARYMMYVIQELSNLRNATFQRVICYHFSEYHIFERKNASIVMISATEESSGASRTEPLIRMDTVWLVPKAQLISDMNAFVYVFNCNLWVAVGVTLISVTSAWFLIISCNGRFTFDKLGLAFTKVWSLTICGCIAQFPRSFALRITLLSYLIYVIHIQCAFTSNMATMLTTPRYGFQIRTLDELAESGLPIYIHESLKSTYFNPNDTNHELYTRLQKQMQFVSVQELLDVTRGFDHYRNSAVVTSVEDLHKTEKQLLRKIDCFQIRDNSMTGVFKIHLALSKDHYFVPTVNSLLSKLEESGISDKLKNDFEDECYPKKVSEDENDEILTLPHLTFIFIFLGLGFCLSFVVFCLEHVVHKFL